MQGLNLILFGVPLLAGLYFIYQGIIQGTKAKKAMETWQKVPGVILSAKISSHRIHNSKRPPHTTYRPDVSYQYEVQGQTYTADSLGFGTSTYGLSKAEKMLSPYAAGGKVTVYYDPQDPAQAVLEPKPLGAANNIVLGIMLILLAIIALIVVPG